MIALSVILGSWLTHPIDLHFREPEERAEEEAIKAAKEWVQEERDRMSNEK